jgi:hypothetical protein
VTESVEEPPDDPPTQPVSAKMDGRIALANIRAGQCPSEGANPPPDNLNRCRSIVIRVLPLN